MAIAANAVSTGDNGAVAATSLTVSHTVAAGSDLVLFACVDTFDGGAPGADPTGVTFNSVALALLDSYAGQSQVSAWWKAGPTATTANIVFTFAAAQDEMASCNLSLAGVHQTVPAGTVTKANGSSATPSTTVTSETGGWVFDFLAAYNPLTLTVGASQDDTSPEGTTNINGTALDSVALSSEAGAASVTMSWTMGQVQVWTIIGIPVKVASASTCKPDMSLLGVGRCSAPMTWLEWLRHRKNKIARIVN